MDGVHEDLEPNINGAQEQVERSPFQRLESHLWRRMASGFFVLIPLLVTFIVLRLVVDYIDGFVRPLPFVEDKPYDVPGIGVVFAVVALYAIGALISTRLGGRVKRLERAVLSRIPIVKTIYGVARQATDTLSAPLGHRFSRVVFIEWPRPGMRAIGFVTGHCHSPSDERTLLVVYIPTVPNPTSGNLAFVSEEEAVETNLTVEDAMKLVFSGGIVLPETWQIPSTVHLPELPKS